MNNQEFFNVVWERAKDRRMAKRDDDVACKYRVMLDSGEVLKCFVGECIPDESYNQQMDTGYVTAYTLLAKFPEACANLKNVEVYLMGECQRIHDFTPPNKWHDTLRDLADEWDLTIPGESEEL